MSYQFQISGLIEQYWRDFLWGSWLTLRLAALAMILGLVIGIALAVALRSHARVLRGLAKGYVEAVRNTPFLVQIFWVYFGLPPLGLRFDPNQAALIALALNAGAYSAEIVRAGIESINRGQVEAGRSLGLRPLHIFGFIILPPAIRAVYPALTSQFILVMLNTSVASAIAAEELTAVSDNLGSITFRSLDVYIIATAIYLIMSLLFSAVFRIGEAVLFRTPMR
jgi:polar amino acid transport system permease protein